MTERIDDGGPAVTVKPLEWRQDADGWSANTVAGLYEFGLVYSGYSVVRRTVDEVGNLDDEVLGRKLEFAEARAAAQADYTRRILSALQPSSEPLNARTQGVEVGR